MNLQIEPDLKVALKHWELRQKRDGCLMWILVVVSLFPLVNYLVSPGDGAKFVMVLFLCSLVMACLRLLKSAAKVVVLRRLVHVSMQ